MVALTVKHHFHSGKGDGPDSTRVKPTAWNENHDLTVDGDGIVLGRPAGAGAGPIVPLDMSALLPAGIILPYAGGVAPNGFLMCFGQLLSRTLEASLFAAIGTTYGPGDGSTTFAAPDGRGVAMVGKTNMGGADKGNLAGGGVLGALLGAQASATGNIHSTGSNNLDFGAVPFSQTFGQITTAPTAIGNGTGAPVQVAVVGDQVVVNGSSHPNGTFGIAVDGSSAPFSVVQPTLIINYIIKR